jgi:PPOX class probable F420-dependent enzyme
MSERRQITLSPAEIDALLASTRHVVLVSNGKDGVPHPMPMWFARDADGALVMTTYAKSQKVRNLERDPRVALLVDDGDEYGELRGVVIYATAELVHDPERAADAMIRYGRIDLAGMPQAQRDAVRSAIRRQAEKRVLLRFQPERIVSWDHRKLAARP